jgi:C4-dicarboxylate-specific signal transduction histidine kinase
MTSNLSSTAVRPRSYANDKKTILIVDDNPSNIQVLAEYLRNDYQLIIAISGPEALACCARKKPPDLILLDIMMPGMDGYEVCARLKENKGLKDIPIIFVTAINNFEEEIRALQAGAVDFITKPINELTARARIATHLELSLLRCQSRAWNQELENKVRQRTEKIYRINIKLQAEIDKRKQTTDLLQKNEIKAMRTAHLAALGTIAAGMAHEINNPNSFISLNVPILRELFEGLMKRMSRKDDQINIGGLSKENLVEVVPELLNGLEEGTRRIGYIINHLKKFSTQEHDNLKIETDINLVVEDAIMLLNNEIKKRGVVLHKNLSQVPGVIAKRYQIEQVVMNLLQNALDSLPGSRRSIWISSCLDDKLQNVQLKIKDEGDGMTSAISNRIFEPFFTTKLDRGGTGLGLAISHSIISDHGGSIEFDSKVSQGTTFTIKLPIETVDVRL